MSLPKDSILVAVASKEGTSISLHFGHAKAFLIFVLNSDGHQFIEKRHVDLYCLGGSSDQTAMQKTLKTLSDTQYVLVAKIGEGPIKKLAAIGSKALDEYAYLGIADSLDALHKRLFP